MAEKVTRMYGTADSFDLEFQNIREGIWRVKAPADLSDGQYAVEIFADTTTGKTLHWTGMLYMSNGEPRVVFHDDAPKLSFVRGCACAL